MTIFNIKGIYEKIFNEINLENVIKNHIVANFNYKYLPWPSPLRRDVTQGRVKCGEPERVRSGQEQNFHELL